MDNPSTYPVSIEENNASFYPVLVAFKWHQNFDKIFLDGPVLFSFVLSRPLKICDFGGDGLMVSRGSRWLQHEDVSKLS